MDLTRVCMDTGPLIAFLKGRDPGAAAIEHAVSTLDCYVTVITAYELLFGVARTRRRSARKVAGDHVDATLYVTIGQIARFLG